MGSAEHPARFHRIGTRIAYASEHAALAVLEAAARDGNLRRIRDNQVLVSMEIPDALVQASGALPNGWDAFPYIEATREIGTDWVASGTSLALRVPSALVPGDNILINPGHPGFAAARNSMGEPRRIPFGGHPLPTG